jgi:hypothetical protein
MLQNDELDRACAYINNTPIHNSDQIIAEKKIVTTPMTSDWKKHLDSKWWGTGYKGEIDDTCLPMIPLRDLLISFGGEEACFVYADSDTGLLLERGQLWYGDRIKKMRGEPSRCRESSIRFWYLNRKVDNGNGIRFASGYALSEDGMWRQHSWCIQVDPKGNKVLEVSEKRKLYFGVLFNDDDCMKIYNYC